MTANSAPRSRGCRPRTQAGGGTGCRARRRRRLLPAPRPRWLLELCLAALDVAARALVRYARSTSPMRLRASSPVRSSTTRPRRITIARSEYLSALWACCSTSSTPVPARRPPRARAASKPVDDKRGETHRQLVGEQDARLAGERPGQRQHLLLAARQQAAAYVEAPLELGEQLERLGYVDAATCRLSRGHAHEDRLLLGDVRESHAGRAGAAAPSWPGRRTHLAGRAAAARRPARAASWSCRRRSGRAGRRPRRARTSRSTSWMTGWPA